MYEISPQVNKFSLYQPKKMQETQNLTNQQKLEQLKKGCQFKYHNDPELIRYSTEPTIQNYFWLLLNGKYLTSVEATPLGSMLIVKYTMFGVTNTFPIDLTLVEIL